MVAIVKLSSHYEGGIIAVTSEILQFSEACSSKILLKIWEYGII